MILDQKKTRRLDYHDFPTLPDGNSAVIKKYRIGELEARLHRGPQLMGDDVVVVAQYSMTVFYKGNYIFAVSIERNDLRAMAPLLGVPVKELQAEYSTKGFYGDGHVVLYGGGEKEDMGLYLGSDQAEEVAAFLLEIVLDTFDEINDPEEIK